MELLLLPLVVGILLGGALVFAATLRFEHEKVRVSSDISDVDIAAQRVHLREHLASATWIDLGRSTGVKREEVVAYADGYDPFPRDQTMLRQDLAAKIRATVLLRNGRIVPCYVTVETLEKRLGVQR